MVYILLNAFSIGVATLAGLIAGAIWLRVSGIDMPGWKRICLAALAEFWLASILAGALILAPPQAGAWTMALGSAFVIWIGFVMPALAVTFMVKDVGRAAIVLATLHWLVVMLLQAIIMQAMGLTAPPGA